jgi:glutathione synthase/RimK-type ligase-like ATP-grasp enzyme
MSVLFTFGVNDRDSVTIHPDPNGEPNFFVDGLTRIMDFVDLGEETADALLIYGPESRQPLVRLQSKPSLIFNQISDADTHTKALDRCSELCKRMDAPVINHPDAIRRTSRDLNFQRLGDIPGVTFPKTIRCSPRSTAEVLEMIGSTGFEYPVIVRQAGLHNAAGMLRLESPEQEADLHRFPFDGREFYLIQFVDFAAENGIYYKHRVAVVDGEPIARHVFFDDNWMVNSGSIGFMDKHPEAGDIASLTAALSEQLIPAAREIFSEMARRLELDYFGVDCHIGPDGNMLVFEANATMGMMIDKSTAISHHRANIVAALEKMIRARSAKNVM